MFGLYVVCLFHGAYLYLHVLILSFLTRRTSCLTALTTFLEPLGEQGQEIGSRIIGFVENVKAGVLGSVGLALLIWTVVSLMQKIETAFNYRSEEHTSELQSLMRITYAVFCLKKKTKNRHAKL